MKLIITAFEPFGGEKINPSAAALDFLGQSFEKEVIGLLLPVSFEKAPQLLCTAIDRFEPDALIMLGQAGGRRSVSLEHVAINFANASIPDNDGALPCYQLLDEQAPAAYFTTLPEAKIISQIEKSGIPCALSLSAGAYVCNAVFFRAMHHLAMAGKRIPAGFIHVPYCTEQLCGKPEGTFALEQEQINESIKIAADLLLSEQR